MSQSSLVRNEKRPSRGAFGILATLLVSGFAVSHIMFIAKPLALESRGPHEDQAWAYQKYAPVNPPRSLVHVDDMLRWEEGSSAIGGSVLRADHVQVPSNSPPEDLLMQTTATDDDGLLGLETALALKKYLIHYLIHELKGDTAEITSSEEVDRALKRAFLNMDRDMMDVATRAVEGPRFLTDALAEVGPAYSGSCALVSYYNEELREVKVACTGDSRAVLGRRNDAGDWEAIPLSFDQTGFNKSEVARLQAEHPNEPDMIRKGRLLGLAVTRAFGDGRWKWSRETQEKAKERFFGPELREPLLTPPYLTAEPVVTTTGIDPDRGDFIIMASDGLWDCLTNEQAVDLVGRWMKTHDVTKAVSPPNLAKSVPDVLKPPDLFRRMKPVPDMKYRKPNDITEKDYVFVDENAATHLARHALGGGNEDLVTGMATAVPPLARKLRYALAFLTAWLGAQF
ncbi:MAG: hypothetical protein Q9217_005047 [Psora testacea]